MNFVPKVIAWRSILKLREKIEKENKIRMKEFVDNYEVEWID